MPKHVPDKETVKCGHTMADKGLAMANGASSMARNLIDDIP